MAGAGAEGDGAAGTAVQRPPQEVISLEADEVPVQRPRGRGRGGARGGGGRGAGRAAERGRGLRQALHKYTRPGPERARRAEGGDPRYRAELNFQLNRRERQDREAVLRLAKGEVLQTAEAGFLRARGGEQTAKLTQRRIEDAAPVGVARKRFELRLPYGPYLCGYTANGSHLLAGGRKGQVALLDCESMHPKAELQLRETVRAVQPLHNQTMFAVAQKKYTHIYDHTGLELHCLKAPKQPSHLEFLPYHYLLVTAGDVLGDLCYRDISSGKEVCTHRTRLGPMRSMRQNPRNAVVHCGHSGGTVTLWTPNVKEPVVKMLCHSGHVTGIAVHGDHMVSSGADGWWKVWDLRTYGCLRSERSFGHAVSDIDVSMTGLVALGFGSHVQIWKDLLRAGQKKLYMTEEYPGKSVASVRFRPYEDIVTVGHSEGFASIIVPGAGFANFDSFEANPFETKQQRREKEVRSLLEKLQPDSIMLDANALGGVNKELAQKDAEESKALKEKAEAKKGRNKPQKKMRGKGKIGRRMKSKSLKEGKSSKEGLKSRLKAQERGEGAGASDSESDGDDNDEEEAGDGGAEEPRQQSAGQVAGALGRFYGKRRRKT